MTAARRLEKAAAVLLLVALGLPLVRTAVAALVVIPAKDWRSANADGTVWRFRSEGNRAALEADPEVIVRRWPLRARELAVPGHPLF